MGKKESSRREFFKCKKWNFFCTLLMCAVFFTSFQVSGKVNLALNKTVLASSIHPHLPSVAEVVDGNTTDGYVHTYKEHEPWLAVDLGKQYNITWIVIYNRMDCCQDRLKNFTVEVWKNRPPADTKYLSTCYQHPGSFSGLILQVKCQERPSGRFVRIRMHNTMSLVYLHLSEIQVFAEEDLAEDHYRLKKTSENVPGTFFLDQFPVRSRLECAIYCHQQPSCSVFRFQNEDETGRLCELKTTRLSGGGHTSPDNYFIQ